ncbi:hypothetical protein ABZ438_20385 [Streptomyces sp. NPDC005786]|uniref:hypothetical protein n=1 Tax=unclassified Streptomyces TaxID=2593676 RepID=UPI0034002C0F
MVVSKQPQSKRHVERLRKVAEAMKDATGFPVRAFSELEELRFDKGGKAPVLGPGSLHEYIRLPTMRTLGYRRAGDRLVPILHTKMMLLGELWWHDEDGLGAERMSPASRRTDCGWAAPTARRVPAESWNSGCGWMILTH